MACVQPVVCVRWVKRDLTLHSSCAHAKTRLGWLVSVCLVCFYAFGGAECHCGQTAL